MSITSNKELKEYLVKCDSEVLFSILGLMDSFFINNNPFLELKTINDIPHPLSEGRNVIVDQAIYLLRYYGSHNIPYIFRGIFSDEPGIDYSEVLYDVTKALSKQLKKSIPRVATVADYEQLLCETLLQIQFQGKNEKEIREMLIDAGLDKGTIEEAIKHFAKIGVGGVGVIGLVKILGKKTVTEMLEKTIVWLVAKKMGREAAEKAATRILKSTTQKTIAKLVSGIGWALLAWDVINLGSPATRKTVPIISLIASMRTIDRLK